MSRLRQNQSRFAQYAAQLIQQAEAMGYEVTLGDAYRDPRSHGELGRRKAYGNKNSNHKKRLAIDLNLFKRGRFLQTTDAHRPLGEWWEALGRKEDAPLRWGGHFNDGNHYEWNA
jgi:hypothetical protein